MDNQEDLLKAIGIVVFLVGVFFAVMAISSLIVPLIIIGGGTYIVYEIIKENKRD